MTKKRVIIILGLILAVLPFSGIPRSAREIISALLGLAVAVVAFLLKRRVDNSAMNARKDTFTQNSAYQDGAEPAVGASDEAVSQ